MVNYLPPFTFPSRDCFKDSKKRIKKDVRIGTWNVHLFRRWYARVKSTGLVYMGYKKFGGTIKIAFYRTNTLCTTREIIHAILERDCVLRTVTRSL